MNSAVSAENAMIQLMYWNEQTMQKFMNEFEALLNDIMWDDGAITVTFRLKLSAWILSCVVTDYFLKLSDSYTVYKEVMLQTELNIALIDAQKQKMHSEELLWKRQRMSDICQSSVNAVSLSERQNSLMTSRCDKLTAEERECWEKYNLCWYCDKLSHQLQNCSE